MFNVKKDELVGNIDDIIDNILSGDDGEYEIDNNKEVEEKDNKKE